MHLEEILQFLLRDKMRRCVFFLENKTVSLILHQKGVLAERRSIVFDAMAGKVEPHGLLHEAVGELFERCWDDLHIDSVSSL